MDAPLLHLNNARSLIKPMRLTEWRNEGRMAEDRQQTKKSFAVVQCQQEIEYVLVKRVVPSIQAHAVLLCVQMKWHGMSERH